MAPKLSESEEKEKRQREHAVAKERWHRVKKATTEKVAGQAGLNLVRSALGQEHVELGETTYTAEEAAKFNEGILKAFAELQKTVTDKNKNAYDIQVKKMSLAQAMLDGAIGHLKTKIKAASTFEAKKLGHQVTRMNKTREELAGIRDAMAPSSAGKSDVDWVDKIASVLARASQEGQLAPPMVEALLKKGQTDAEIDEIKTRIWQQVDHPDTQFNLNLTPVELEKLAQAAKDSRAAGVIVPASLENMDPASRKIMEKFNSPAEVKAHYETMSTLINEAYAATGGDIDPMIRQMSQALAGDPTKVTLPESIDAFVGETPEAAAASRAELQEASRNRSDLLGQMLQPNATPTLIQARQALLNMPETREEMDRLGVDERGYLSLTRGNEIRKARERRASSASSEARIKAGGYRELDDPTKMIISQTRRTLGDAARGKASSGAPGAQMLSHNLKDIDEKVT